jgi:hypothetical protein
MSSIYHQTAECASRIIDVVGPCNGDIGSLSLSGRQPTFPKATLELLLPKTAYEQLDSSSKSNIAGILERRLSALRESSVQRFRHAAGQHLSLATCGLSDMDVETGLIRMYESRYQLFLDQIRGMLLRLLARRAESVDNRSTKGGFGDVSTPICLPN